MGKSRRNAGFLPDNAKADLQRIMKKSASIVTELRRESKLLMEKAQHARFGDPVVDQLWDFVRSCDEKANGMRSRRKLYTDKLLKFRNIFTSQENELSTSKPGSIGSAARERLKCIYQAELNRQDEERSMLELELNRKLDAISLRTDWTDEEKQEAEYAARNELATCVAAFPTIRFGYEPVPVNPDGYLELFKFWWEETGRRLSDEDLKRFFHLPITFARRKAVKGEFVKSPLVEYVKEPLVA